MRSDSFFTTSALTLKRMAALVWYAGGVVLLIKSSGLFVAALKNGASPQWVSVAILGGMGIGWLKARYLFVRLCQKNLKRIRALQKPMLWQFYRGRFFAFLCLMVSLGAYLARQARGDHVGLIALAVVELSVAMALLASSRCFWRENNDA